MPISKSHAATSAPGGEARDLCSHRAVLGPGESIADLLVRKNLFTEDDAGIARLPALVGGALWVPALPQSCLARSSGEVGAPLRLRYSREAATRNGNERTGWATSPPGRDCGCGVTRIARLW